MQKKICILFAAVFAVLLLLVSVRDIVLNPPIDIREVDAIRLFQNLDSFDEPTNWAYLDADYDYHGDELPAELTSPEAPWKPYDFPDRPPLHADDHHVVWLRLTLPDDVKTGDALFFDAIDQSFRIWVDDRLIYTYGLTDHSNFTYGRQWHIVPLPRSSAEKIVTIEAHSEHPYRLGVFERFLIREVGISYLLLLIYDIPSILGISVGITLILFTLVYMRSKTSSDATFRSFILFMSIFILWMLASSNCSRVLLKAPDFWWDIHLITVYLMLPAGHYMLMHMADKEYTRRFCILIAAHLLILFTAIVIDLTMYHGTLFYVRQYYFCFAVIAGIPAFYWVYRSGKNGNPFSSSIVWPVAICFAACAVDCISLQYRLWPRTIYYTAFTAPLFTVFLIRLLDINVRGRLDAELRIRKLDEDVKAAQEQAHIDPLTNVFNRRKFEESYQRCLDVALSTDRRFSLLILDIDHFKLVNDTWGHSTGDLTLKHFSRLILSMTDRRHTLIRWGGEEFILLCQHQDLSEAAAFAERIRRQVEYSQINPYAPLTCSIGVSTWHEGSIDPMEIVNRADEALYRAKENGRNRVEIETYGSTDKTKLVRLV